MEGPTIQPSASDAPAAQYSKAEMMFKPIILRAPDGEKDWTLIELQGTIEPRNGTDSLDGIRLGQLVRPEDVRGPRAPAGAMHGLAPDAASLARAHPLSCVAFAGRPTQACDGEDAT